MNRKSEVMEPMAVLLDFSMTPLGVGESVSQYVARSLEIIEASGLDYRLHAMGTVIEGEWDDVFDVVRRCHEVMSADCDRITCSIKIDSRTGATGRLTAKITSVEQKLGHKLKSTEAEQSTQADASASSSNEVRHEKRSSCESNQQLENEQVIDV